jgi:hypothetical protein
VLFPRSVDDTKFDLICGLLSAFSGGMLTGAGQMMRIKYRQLKRELNAPNAGGD